MKQRTKVVLWILGVLVALAAVPTWHVAKFAYHVRNFDADAERAKPPRFTAYASLQGFDVTFDLYPRHPFLAEYTIMVTVAHSGRALAKEEFIDTGGLSDFYCIESKNDVLITNWNKDGLVIDTTRRKISPMDYTRFPEDYESRSFGRFGFGSGNERKYEYKKMSPTSSSRDF